MNDSRHIDLRTLRFGWGTLNALNVDETTVCMGTMRLTFIFSETAVVCISGGKNLCVVRWVDNFLLVLGRPQKWVKACTFWFSILSLELIQVWPYSSNPLKCAASERVRISIEVTSSILQNKIQGMKSFSSRVIAVTAWMLRTVSLSGFWYVRDTKMVAWGRIS